MPDPFARFRVQTQDAVAEQVLADALAAPEVERRRTGADKDQAAFMIDAHAAPVVGAAGCLPRIFRPGLVAELAGVRDGVEDPTALAGADFLFYPTAIGWQFDEGEAIDAAQRDAWMTIQRSHAIANGVYVAAVNRVGHETLDGAEGGGIRFWGSSFVVDPFGRVLVTAPDDEEAVLVVECDLGAIERVRRDWPFLRDRRIDAYDGLRRRFLDDPSRLADLAGSNLEFASVDLEFLTHLAGRRFHQR